MRQDVVVVNRDDVSRACAQAINDMQIPEDNVEFYAMHLMELTMFGALVVSRLFEDKEDEE